MNLTSILGAALLAASFAAAASAQQPTPSAEAMADAVAQAGIALDRGYGGMCDLRALPVAPPAPGYYRCLDIGPYRFVKEYSDTGYRMAVYLAASGDPFRFLQTDRNGTVLLFKGPWENDLLPRVRKYFDDVSGTAAARRQQSEAETKRVEAERRLHQFIDKEASPNKPETNTAPGTDGDRK